MIWATLRTCCGRRLFAFARFDILEASAKDLVGALIKEAGLQKGQIGRIDVRETFSLVDVAPAVVDQAIRRMSGVSVRGRRVTARPDKT